jgi:hypothetical protein
MQRRQFLSIIILFFWSVYGQTHLPTHYLTPQRDFYHVEIACQQLWNDLELMQTNPSFAQQITTNLYLLHNQCTFLYQSVVKLERTSTDEFYLPEDIQYLLIMVGLIAAKYKHICSIINFDEHCIEQLLQTARYSLSDLLERTSKIVQ